MNSEITKSDGLSLTQAKPDAQREKLTTVKEDWDRISTPESLEATKDEFDDLIESVNLKEEDKTDLKLGFIEVATNAMLHGNKFSGDHVSISIRITPEQAIITAQDYGEGFDPNAVPDPTDPANLLKTSGRGLFMLKENLKFQIEHSDGGRKITITRKLNQHPKEEK